VLKHLLSDFLLLFVELALDRRIQFLWNEVWRILEAMALIFVIINQPNEGQNFLGTLLLSRISLY
jgi:hypothetical protein